MLSLWYVINSFYCYYGRIFLAIKSLIVYVPAIWFIFFPHHRILLLIRGGAGARILKPSGLLYHNMHIHRILYICNICNTPGGWAGCWVGGWVHGWSTLCCWEFELNLIGFTRGKAWKCSLNPFLFARVPLHIYFLPVTSMLGTDGGGRGGGLRDQGTGVYGSYDHILY